MDATLVLSMIGPLGGKLNFLIDLKETLKSKRERILEILKEIKE